MGCFKKIGILLAVLATVLFYNNCSKPSPKDSLHSGSSMVDSSSMGDFVEADFLKEEKPDLLCGQEGYEYLMREYFEEHCDSCHIKGSNFPPAFADKNFMFDSYNSARYIEESVFLQTITDNRFCGNECSLNPEGETYKAIVEWIENKWLCP